MSGGPKQNFVPPILSSLCRTKVLGIAILLLAFSTGAAQEQELCFEHLGTAEGLSQNTVQAILEDHLGYLWFGTLDGLNRYDGYEFVTYQHSPWDSTSIGNNNVWCLDEDSQGTLWMVTAKGISCLRFVCREAGKFHNFAIPGISAIMVDKQDEVLAGGTGLMKFSREVQKFVSLDSLYPEVKHVAINVLLRDRHGTLWIGSIHEGLFAISEKDTGEGRVRHYCHDSRDPTSLSGNYIKTIFEDSHGNLWIGMVDRGLNRLLRATDTFDCPVSPLLTGTPDRPITVAAILEDTQQCLWIGTYPIGLVHFNPKTGEVKVYSHDPVAPHSLSHSSVVSLWQDYCGMLWIGTNGGGLNRFDPGQLAIRHYQYEPGNPASLNHNSVWSFYEDRVGNFWIGTSLGLSQMRVDATGNARFEPLLLPSAQSTSPLLASRESLILPEAPPTSFSPTVTVRAMCEDRKGRFWIGTQGNGLLEYNPATKAWRQYRYREGDSASIPSDYVYALLMNSWGELWIGVNGRGGVCRLIPQVARRHRFQRYVTVVDTVVGREIEWVLCLYEDRKGALWLGSWDYGLVQYDRENDRLVPLKAMLEGGKPLGEYTVLCIAEDDSGSLWLGTHGLGLCRMQELRQDTVLLKSYTTRKGLPNNMVYAILNGGQGNLWVSTNRGISRFNPKTEHFQNFTLADGLQGMEFNLGAAYRRRNGELFFGGNNGFNAFYPSDLMNETPPRVLLTAFKKFGKKIFFKTHPSELRMIDLSYKDDYITLEYIGLHYKHPVQNQYAYILEGFDREWHYVGNNREAIYTNLPPGTYTFWVKAANSDGIWSAPSIGLKLRVHPPFWETWWFSLICAVSIGLIVLAWHQFRVRRALAIERARIAERERERERIRRDLHVDLGGKLSALRLRLEKQLKYLSGQPLTAIRNLNRAIGLLQELEHLFREYLWVLNRKQMFLFDLVAQLKDYGETLFQDTPIVFRIEGISENARKFILPLSWRQHLVRIFKEGLNNILKHGSGCREVKLEIFVKGRELQICLTDDGPGFDPENLANGYGLEDIRDRAGKISGELIIRSVPGEGTQICFRGECPENPTQ
ncbi:MAG: hypothetical protein D6732_20455 [Methanobacteriota archaeon]|nr:MAG: hypothetical protein D6732_20455 [Euryarchaeota archaeon]